MMQKTSFLFEVLIHDDASTDDTARIIAEYQQKYPDLIKPIFQTENQYTRGVKVSAFNFLRAKGEYLALCEGDDYWTDPLKLQKQVDYLENHPECGMVCTDVVRYMQHTGKYMKSGIPAFDVATYRDIVNWKNQVCTLTVCYRKSLIWNDPPLDPEKYFLGDVFRFLQVSLTHTIKFLPDVTGVYRVLQNSASHFQNRVDKVLFTYKVSNTFLWFLSHYPLQDMHEQSRLENVHKMAIFAYAKLTEDYALSRAIRFDLPRKMRSGYSLIFLQHLFCKNPWLFKRLSRRNNSIVV